MNAVVSVNAAVRPSPSAARLALLSPRESQVMDLIAEGLANASIARRLHMTEASILAKLGCASRVQAALMARDAVTGGLHPPDRRR